jgi:hypothetical protein
MFMAQKVDAEIEAIKTVLNTLRSLDPDARQAVVEYVLKRLDLPLSRVIAGAPTSRTALVERIDAALEPVRTESEPPAQIHLRDLKEQKKPKSAIEMAVLVAYYLSHVLPPNERKLTISNADIETYFKIGGYKLPSRPEFTLPNAKNAGYLDPAGRGEYKLNPVGYNLVVHSLPRSGKSSM